MLCGRGQRVKVLLPPRQESLLNFRFYPKHNWMILIVETEHGGIVASEEHGVTVLESANTGYSLCIIQH